ncbi:MAG: S8 family serine peptidase [Comamonadaceae bacterium]|nr:S8 family serine peptidase [Comamonadaceae bacterium]
MTISANVAASKSLEQLRSKAQNGLPIRVIVGMRVPFAPEGLLSAANLNQQQDDIATARTSLLNKMPTLRNKLDKVKNFDHIPFVALEVDATELEQLANLVEVTSIEEDQLMFVSLAQSVPLVGGTTAWTSGYTGAGRTVAVLDTGVDKNHPFLNGKVVSEACYSTTYSGYGSTSVCPGGVTTSTEAGSALPYASGVCPAGKCDHGTHVAGIVAGNDGSKFGVAKDANLIAIQVFSRFDGTAWCVSSASCALTWSSDQVLACKGCTHCATPTTLIPSI